MLVNAILLVPVVPTSTTESSDRTSSSSDFHRGNYFQLCGPPLTMVSKKFDWMTNSTRKDRKSSASAATTNRVNDNVHRDESSRRDTNSDRWDPNKLIPRGNLFYCEFYTKHVGLSPRHLLNQEENHHCGDKELEGPAHHPQSLSGRKRTNYSLSGMVDVSIAAIMLGE